MPLEIGEAVDLFGTLFTLSIWAVGFISLAYLMAILRVFGTRLKALGQSFRIARK